MLRRMRFTGYWAGVILSPAIIVPLAGASPPKLAVGQPFPDITLPALVDGQPRSLADFRGHKLILHVFASW